MAIINNLNTWIFFGSIELILVLGLFWSIKGNLNKYIKYVFGVVLGLFLISNGLKVVILYQAIKQSPLATYLLSGKNSFFVDRVEKFAIYLGLVILVAAALYLVSRVLLSRQKKPLLEKEFPLTIATVTLASGLRNIIPVILLGLILGVIYQVIQIRKKNRISLIPFLLIATIIINLVNIFPFWQKVLENLHLV